MEKTAAPRPQRGQIMGQATTLGWRVPCPAAPTGPVPFAPLQKLHQAALAAWPSVDALNTTGKVQSPEPLLTYAAALFVSARQRPEMAHILKTLGASVLHALAFVYAQSAPAAAARAAHHAVDTWSALGLPIPWAPTALVLLLDLQGQAHTQWSLGGGGGGGEPAHALRIAGLYAAAETDEDELIGGHVRAGRAFWTSVALRTSAPATPTTHERMTLTGTYLSEQLTLAERYLEAAASTLESAVRGVPAMEKGLTPLLKTTREEATSRRNARLAYEHSVGAYVERDLSQLGQPPLELPEPAALAQPRGPSFDATLQQAMDAWAASQAALSLGATKATAPAAAYSLPSIVARLMGLKEEVVVKTNPTLRTVDTWCAAVLSATHVFEQAYELGYGGPDRTEGLAEVREARALLLSS